MLPWYGFIGLWVAAQPHQGDLTEAGAVNVVVVTVGVMGRQEQALDS
jgi:hypothetical protein